MIKIKYIDIEGILNTETNEVMFYQFKYENILEAIKKLENDIKSNKKEIEIFDELIGQLFTASD